MLKLLSLLLAVGLLSSCTSLQTLSLTSIPAKRDKPVRAEVSKIVFMAFTFDNDFVDDMTNQLKRQCPNGVVSGVLTKDEVVDYFLMLVWRHRVTATGYCVQSTQASIQKNPRTPGSEHLSDSEMPQ